MSTFPPHLCAFLRERRTQHPGWGAKTLRAELGCTFQEDRERLPSEAVITRWLRQEKLSRRYEKHQALPTACLSPTGACHEEWEMDARGYEHLLDVGVISLININDVFSRVKIISYPCWLGDQRVIRHPTTEDYQLALRLAFMEWGLPDRLAVDRESVFHDNLSRSPYPTRLHCWLLALGIELTFGRPNQPRDQAITERSHQTWASQVLEGASFARRELLWQALQQRRRFLNEALPCASLHNVPPLLAYPEARLPRRLYRPEWEQQLLHLPPVHDYLARCRWFRKGSNIGSVSLGGEVYVLGRPWARAEIEITFDAQTQQLIFSTTGQRKQLPPRALSGEALMGEIKPLITQQSWQPALPLTWEEWRLTHYCHILTGTTL